VVGPGGCLSGLQGLVAMFGYMGCNRHLLKQRRAFGPIGASENLSKSWIRERNQKHLSLLKTFYKLFYWSKKKESINIKQWITWVRSKQIGASENLSKSWI
jgi:hypothetical protein